MAAPNAIQIVYECLTDATAPVYAYTGTRVWCPQAPDSWKNTQAAIIFRVYSDVSHVSQQSDLTAIVTFEAFSGNDSWADIRTIHEALRATIQRRGKRYASGAISLARCIGGNQGTFIEGPAKGTFWRIAESEYSIRFTP